MGVIDGNSESIDVMPIYKQLHEDTQYQRISPAANVWHVSKQTPIRV